MPIVILLDVSLSMARPVPQDASKVLTRAALAADGINTLLDHLAVHSRLEFVSLVVFSSLYEVVAGFTRDYEIIRQKLKMLDDYDKTCLDSAIVGAYHLVMTEWGHQTHTHIILITDGCVDETGTIPPATFPCTLHILCVAPPDDQSLTIASPIYHKLIDSVSVSGAPLGGLYIPDQPLSVSSINFMVKRFCTEQLSPWKGIIRCGTLEDHVSLSPVPLPYTHTTDFNSVKLTMSTTLEICGFIGMQEIGSPMALSRHLVLPVPLSVSQPKSAIAGKGESSSELPNTSEEETCDAGKQPNFCILLHGALKVENMAGLVQLGDDWYGLVHSWADCKKKFNLMLSVLPPGDEPLPWLGPLSQLGVHDPSENGETFPVRITERRSYSSAGGSAGSGSAWVHPSGFSADLHKLLRHARKLPDKVNHFYKEVNRVKRAALALGWIEALEATAGILEREIPLLPQGAKLPLTIAAHHLMNTRDPKSQLPLT